MKKKRIIKVTLVIIALIILVTTLLTTYGYFYVKKAYNTESKPYKNYIGYIDKDNALLNDTYNLCNEGSLYHTYSSASLKAYTGSKKQFRDNLESSFNIKSNYTDSGYLNFRFLVNCEGNAGWFEIIEMDLDLKESPLKKEMVNELFEFTSNSKNWSIININENPQNYYMYISYRIENGKITEILP